MKTSIKIKFLAIVFTFLLSVIGCDKQTQTVSDNLSTGSVYRNPIIPKSLPDPTIIKASNGYFYLYATEDTRNIPIYKTKNLVSWEFIGTAFTDGTRPTFEANGGLWAPDINYINGKYILYYSMSVWGAEWTCGIGVSVSDTPDGPFTDYGKLFRSNEIGVQNSIDPFYIEENGKNYLFWGSFSGIYAIELSEDGLSVKPGVEKRQVAGTAYEGSYICKNENWYYYFASTGTCCEGVNSTYTTVVGRSENIFGPYLNKAGQSMMDNHHEIFIGKNARFVGTGHNSEIISDDSGQSWILYHAVDKNNPDGRVLMLDAVAWENGWPKMKDNQPGIGFQKVPEFG